MSKNINDIAAEWEEISAELDPSERFNALDRFIYSYDLFDVNAINVYFGGTIQNYLEGRFRRIDTWDGESLGKSGERFLRSLPNAVIEDGVYAVMDTDGLIAHAAEVLRERLAGDYYDCNDVCEREGECNHALWRYNAERGAAGHFRPDLSRR